jgi:PKD repeat protein
MNRAKPMKMVRVLWMAMIVALLFCESADAQQASEVWVNSGYCEGCPNDGHTWGYDAFATVQEGIDNAASPGSVHVAAGTYVENITMKNGVNVLGAGSDLTVIDGGGTGTVVTFGWLDQETTIEDFTFQNGRSYGFSGSGVSISASPAIVRKNIITAGQGWAIGISGMASPTIQQNTITQNGGGILILGSTPVFIGNVIKQNRGCGIETMNTNIFTVVNNLICENEGDGVKFLIPSGSGDVKIINNTIVGNTGAGINGNRDPSLKVLNNIIMGNSTCGINFDSSYDGGTAESNYNDVWNNTGDDYSGLAVAGSNDLPADPLFRNASGGDYHIWPFSPCVDAGTLSDSPTSDFEGDTRPVDGNKDGTAAVDLGADETGILFDRDIMTYSILPDPLFLQMGSAFIPQVKVLNIGTQEENNVPVSCEIKRNDTVIFSHQRTVEQLPSKVAEEVVFSEWTPQETGEYELTFSSQLAADENIANDTQRRTVQVVSLQAAYRYDLKQGGLPLEIQFTDQSTGEIAQWHWDFGDNTTGTDRNPAHAYAEPGTYTVTLSVSKGDASDTQTQTVVLLDIFGMELGNMWNFQGSEQGIPFSSEQEIVTIPQQTYDATGKWRFSLANGSVEDPGGVGCQAVPDTEGDAYVTQMGETVTLTIDGTPYAGSADGSSYYLSFSYFLDDGSTVEETLDLTLSNADSGSGRLYWELIGSAYCYGENELTMTRPDTETGLPANLFIQEERKDGIPKGSFWYERTAGQVKYWGFQTFQDDMPYNFRFSDGLLVAWYPMAAGDHKESSADVVGFPGMRVSMVVDVLALEDLSLSFGTVKAYKLRFQFRTWGNGTDETETFYRWMVPYLGGVKSEEDISVKELTSFAIGGGTVDLESDADGDTLKDYQELTVYRTNWQNGDTDGDGCGDGVEVQGGRDPKAVDPQGDLNKDCALDLRDLIAGLQLLNKSQVPSITSTDGDVNGDGKIGLPDVLYVLQHVAGVR